MVGKLNLAIGNLLGVKIFARECKLKRRMVRRDVGVSARARRVDGDLNEVTEMRSMLEVEDHGQNTQDQAKISIEMGKFRLEIENKESSC